MELVLGSWSCFECRTGRMEVQASQWRMEFHELQSIVESTARSIKTLTDGTAQFRRSTAQFRRSVEMGIEQDRAERQELREAMQRMADAHAGIANRLASLDG